MSRRIWMAAHVFREGEAIRYCFYDNEGKTEQFMHGPVPVTVGVVFTPEEALDLAWSLFEDVSKVAPQLAAPSVSRRTYDLLEDAVKQMRQDFDSAMERIPQALKQKESEWKSTYRLRPSASEAEADLNDLFPCKHPDCPSNECVEEAEFATEAEKEPQLSNNQSRSETLHDQGAKVAGLNGPVPDH